MNEAQALSKMIAPGTPRPGKWRGGVIQIWTTRACDNSCFGCTQGSNLGGKPGMISVEQFEQACISLKGYYGVVGMFGGNPAMHTKFAQLCEVMRKHVPFEQRGLWCNNPITVENARIMKDTFNPSVSNLNCHLNAEAFKLFKAGWPQSMPFGLDRDSRHAPVHLAMKDVIPDEGKRWELISGCDINQHWSAMIGVFRGELRAWFCEVAGAQSMLHQDDPDYPDTGIKLIEIEGELYCGFEHALRDPVDPNRDMIKWWKLPMYYFKGQVNKHCHECGVPLRGMGELAMTEDGPGGGVEQTSATHAGIFKPKRKERKVTIVSNLIELGTARVNKVTDYYRNGRK
jgi:hypothetical protein